jgi:hypothetical protein
MIRLHNALLHLEFQGWEAASKEPAFVQCRFGARARRWGAAPASLRRAFGTTAIRSITTLCLLKTPSRSSEAAVEGKSTHFVVRCATTIARQTA